jgi:lipopolysaccharide/colanic/teichoic acid biosynthesis glycosyltransferase
VYKKYFKRLLDLVMALLGLTILGPVLLVVAALVLAKLGSPVVFRQQRPGLNETVFTLYKFRTMVDERDKDGKLLPDEVRLTSLGKFLRSTSLDELPELWNILKGEMSFVGPRPLLVEYLPLYNDEQRRRHEVRPGLTGLAQTSGRNLLSWEQRFQLDVQYIDTLSLWNDLRILLRTLLSVIRKDGINSADSVTMSRFEGTI